jgi:hypothetical protein
MECSLLALSDTSINSISQYALKITMPPAILSQRPSTHFIIVIDVSESMLDSNKLEDVKHSAGLVLHFLGASDMLSIITFGSNAIINASCVLCSAGNKALLQSTIEGIQAEGCTNLSAGFACIKSVLSECTSSSVKTGVIILTDGYANRGVRSSAGLLDILEQVRVSAPSLTFQFVGYGTEHNSELLKCMAEKVQGSYSIVENKEGAASVIGDSLGSLFSCAAQLVRLECTDTVNVHGPYNRSPDGSIHIGDIYSDSETILLMDIHSSVASDPMFLKGTYLSTLSTFSIIPTRVDWQASVEPDASITLTYLRYKCSSLFKAVRTLSQTPSTEQKDALRKNIADFKVSLQNPRFINHPVAQLLKNECKSLEEAFMIVSNSYIQPSDIMARLTQHEAFTQMGRGTAQPINATSSGSPSLSPYLTSPTRNNVQTRVTQLMSAMSMGGEDPNMIDEANQFSQAPNPS